MNAAYVRLGGVLDRIASATSIRRTRDDDAARRERHAGEPADALARVEAIASRLERVADQLEERL